MLHMVPAPGTIFAGVRKLRPGYYVTCENGALQERRYWQERFDETACGDFQSLRDGLHAALRTAVRDCRPGQTSGAFLSGGLDSSTVVGVLSETTPPPARTFSIGFGYPDYDELSYARIANARFGCEGHEYVVTGHDIADGFSVIARSYDEPFGNSSALPVYFCARLARECGVDHLLAGDGGDELFAGNSRYAEQAVFERYQRIPLLLRRFLLEPALRSWPLAASFGLVRKGRGYVEKANVPLPLRLEAWNFLHRTGANAILHPDFLMRVDEDATLAGMQELWDSAPGESALNRMLHYDWQYTLSDNDLRKVETMSKLAGVRVSYPMLHPDIVGLSMRVPPGMKMPGTLLRHFYKEAMAGYLPDEIIQKKKQGFGLPFGLWLKETPELRSQIDEALLSLRSREIVRADFIDRLLHLHGQEDAKYYGVFIWVLAMLEQWFREHGLSP
jgi:asparagine synthase (glutamine-hydrolysing)